MTEPEGTLWAGFAPLTWGNGMPPSSIKCCGSKGSNGPFKSAPSTWTDPAHRQRSLFLQAVQHIHIR